MAKEQIISTGELQALMKEDTDVEFWNVLTDEYFSGEMIPGSRRVPLDRVGREVSGKAALDGIADTHALAAPAHGTPAPPEGFGMAGWASLLMDELDRRSVDQAIFVGHSMSGWLAQQIWRDHPQRVLGIGLVGATERPATLDAQKKFAERMDSIAHDWRALAPAVANLLVGSDFLAVNPGWVDRWTDHVEKTYDLAGMKRLIAAINRRPDYAPTTSRIDVPATVIHGNDDRVFPLDVGRRLASLIADADYAEIEGAGHAPPMERPAPVNAAVCALVERVIDAPLPARRRNPDSSLRLGLTQ